MKNPFLAGLNAGAFVVNCWLAGFNWAVGASNLTVTLNIFCAIICAGALWMCAGKKTK